MKQCVLMTGRLRLPVALVLTACLLMVGGCQSTGAGEAVARDSDLESRARATIVQSLDEDPSLQRFYDDSAGYVVFPAVGKGGLIVGGAHGKGVLFNDRREPLGYATMTAATIGAQIGGQSFKEIIFFEDDFQIERFKRSEWQTGANASAVAIQAGASAAADYDRGVAIFVMGERGLMLEASVGGQKFEYMPLRDE